MPVTVLCSSSPQVHAAQIFISLQPVYRLDRNTIKFLDKTKISTSISTKTWASSNTKTGASTSTNSEQVHPSTVTSGAALAPLPSQPHATPTLQLGRTAAASALLQRHLYTASIAPQRRRNEALTQLYAIAVPPPPPARKKSGQGY